MNSNYVNRVCSCGVLEEHIIRKATTFDGKQIILWSTGIITSGRFFLLKGHGRAHTAWEKSRNVEAGNAVLDNAELIDYVEVSAAFKIAKAFARQYGVSYCQPGDWRAHIFSRLSLR